ncbi:MFS myo-inositol transporter [Schizosaccharomyces cryophilus OY26]|uniref:MFS myo-inositol transporter n=1 Tax=Schizosaccharomyces cryophilus (strain OY26 / ATCC MYA-4695 / CBS 11777 / NBRC 106824 / NRRL Y48691) TaxID=653667 RepID=S9VXL1_SCHCR|nr:MFS myo-inositol transporter [Schizosaccharomyces cryophilus OY26]EPY50939.1 MFS myo-inositol transporter [Schizosaccharomyces cryophilus OY26]
MDIKGIPLTTFASSFDSPKEDLNKPLVSYPPSNKKSSDGRESLEEVPIRATDTNVVLSLDPDNPVDETSPKEFHEEKISSWIWILSTVAGISGLLFGYDTGVISGALAVIGSDLGSELSSKQRELITSATPFAALLSGITSGWLADLLGRKRLLMYADGIFVLGSIVMAVARNIATLVAGRFIVGWGIGLASLIVPMYITELAPAHMRGRLVIIYVVFITGGQLVAYSLNAAFENVRQGWRIMMGLGALPALCQLIPLFWTPESPRYLLKQNHVEKVYKIMSRIHPNARPGEIAYKVSLIQEGMNFSSLEGNQFQRVKHSFNRLWSVPSNRRSLFIACFLQAFQQFSGTNAIQYFSAILFESVGFKNSIQISIVVGATNFLFTILAFMFIDRIGRRRILLYSATTMIIALSVCAVSYHFLELKKTEWKYVTLVSIIAFLASYAFGIGNIPWQQAELFPMEVRALGTGFSTAVNWSGNLIVSATFLTMMESITSVGTFGLYAGFCFVGLITCFFTYPELAGMSIEHISILLEKGFWNAVKEQDNKSKNEIKDTY